jgi:hypothetical protein
MKRALFAVIFLLPILLKAQEGDKKFSVSLNGFVKNDFFWDSRQTVDVREGHFYLYPANELLDKNGEDINARSNFNFLSIQTRLRADITGPDVLGAKTSAAIEGEFFGHSNGDINGFRLRHAYIKLNWTSTELLVGQFWHPMFITSSYPGTVNFNTGVPFLPFTRNPQIRISQRLGSFKAYITALSQVDFRSPGPDGASVQYLRNTAIPALNLNLEYNIDRDGFKFLLGVAGGYKTLLPRMVTDSNFKTKEKISTLCAQAYIKVAIPQLTIKLAGSYAQDAYDLTMIGGYAVTTVTDTLRDFREYTPFGTLSFWADIHTNGKRLQGGLFFGYSKNLGTAETYYGDVYARGANIGYLYRISPRLIYNVNKFRIAPEIDYTVAAYGTLNTGSDGIPVNTKEIGNFRFLLGVYYFF